MRYLWWLQALLLIVVIPVVMNRVVPGSLESLPGLVAWAMSPVIFWAMGLLILVALLRAILPYDRVHENSNSPGS